MKYIPYGYQKYALDFILKRPAAGIFLDCGLGKTVITLTAVLELMHNQFEITKTLVIAPLRVAENIWDREARKWEHLKHLRIVKVLGSKHERLRALNTDADIYVINRENTKWLVDYYQKDWPFDMLVLDELSSFKSHRAKRFKALRKVRPLCKRWWDLPAHRPLTDCLIYGHRFTF